MEIGPVAGVRAIPTVKEPPADVGLSGVFDIENFARIGDETYTPSGGKSAGGREDEFDDPLQEDQPQPGAQNDALSRKISFFV